MRLSPCLVLDLSLTPAGLGRLAAAACLLAGFAAVAEADERLAEVTASVDAIEVQPLVTGPALFTLAGDSGYRFETLIEAGESLHLPLVDPDLQSGTDAVYVWEIRLIDQDSGPKELDSPPGVPAVV